MTLKNLINSTKLAIFYMQCWSQLIKKPHYFCKNKIRTEFKTLYYLNIRILNILSVYLDKY